MKRFFLLLLLCFTAYQCFGQTKKDSRPVFSGIWYLTSMETNNKIPGFQPAIKKNKLVEVVHNDPSLRIITKEKDGEKYNVLDDYTYYTDKRGETNSVNSDSQLIQLASTTQWEDGKIVIKNNADKNNKKEWELSSDGTRLIQKVHIKTQFDKFYIALIFTKTPQ